MLRTLNVKMILTITFWFVVATVGLYWFVWGVNQHHKHNYAGLHFSTGSNKAMKAMQLRYGGKLAGQLRYGEPADAHTHLNDVMFGGDQVRVYHLVGPKGVRYCVPVRQGVRPERSQSAIVKGCSW